MVNNRDQRPKKRIRINQPTPRISTQIGHGRHTFTIHGSTEDSPAVQRPTTSRGNGRRSYKGGSSTPVVPGFRPLEISMGDEPISNERRNSTPVTPAPRRRRIGARSTTPVTPAPRRRTITIGSERRTTPVTCATGRRNIIIGSTRRLNAANTNPVTPARGPPSITIGSRRRANGENKTALTPVAIPRPFSFESQRRSYSPTSGWTDIFANSVRGPETIGYAGGRSITIIPPAPNPRAKFSIQNGAKITIAGNPSRTQFYDVRRQVGPREARMRNGKEDGILPTPVREDTFVDTFLHIPIHTARVSFRARCCCNFPDIKLRVLVDSDNYFAFVRLDAEESKENVEIDMRPAIYKDFQRDDRPLPKALLLFLFKQADKLNLFVGEPPNMDHLLAAIPVFKRCSASKMIEIPNVPPRRVRPPRQLRSRSGGKLLAVL